MSDLSQRDPTGRFTGLAGSYARFRPSYPAEAIEFMRDRCHLEPGSVVVDVGAGTGISARLFAALACRVIGIEPNPEMRAVAEATEPGPTERTLIYQDGQAEATGLETGIADLVLAAQAYHWFQVEPTLSEFHRILKSEGWVALMWNERDERDPFSAAYGDIIRLASSATAIEKPRQGLAGKSLLSHPLFHHGERIDFPNNQVLDEEGLLGRSFSASYAPRKPAEIALWTNGIKALFAKSQRDGQVVLHYQTSVYLAQRR